MQSDQINELMSALNRAQLAMVPAKKDSENPFFKSHYADLSTVWDALHPFRAEGIVFTQCPFESPAGTIGIETQLTHAPSGQWIAGRLQLPLAKNDPQGCGSAITYARRYALGCMTGLVTAEDDDGHAASQPQATTKNFAQKFPEQAKAIQEKLKPAAVQAAAPASLLPGDGTWIVPFGKSKGQRIGDVADGDVEYLIKYYAAKLNDPANATSRFREEWENALIEIQGELMQRFPVSQA